MAECSRATNEAIRAAMDHVRERHRTGGEIRGLGLTDKRAAKTLGLSVNETTQCRHFADPETGFTEAELDALEELCRAAGFAPGFTLIARISHVPREERAGLLRDAIAGRWSKKELERELDRRWPNRRRRAGRRPHVPADAAGLTSQLGRQSASWRRLVETAKGKDGSGLSRLPPRVRAKVEEADRRMRELIEAIAAG